MKEARRCSESDWREARVEENNRQNSRAAGEIDDSIIARGSRDLVVASKRKVEKGKRANREGAVGGNTGGRQDWGNCDGARRLLRCWLDGATWATEPFPSCDPRIPHPTPGPCCFGPARLHTLLCSEVPQTFTPDVQPV